MGSLVSAKRHIYYKNSVMRNRNVTLRSVRKKQCVKDILDFLNIKEFEILKKNMH